jgi:hypothetical protein
VRCIFWPTFALISLTFAGNSGVFWPKFEFCIFWPTSTPFSLTFAGIFGGLWPKFAGTNAWSMLNGKIIPLKHGYVGVVNRSQYDIDNEVNFSAFFLGFFRLSVEISPLGGFAARFGGFSFFLFFF